MLGFALIGTLFVDGLPLVGRNLKNFAFVLEEHHGHGGLCAVAAGAVRADDRGSAGIWHGELIFQKTLSGPTLRTATERKSCSPACHVCYTGCRTFAPHLRPHAPS